MKIESELFGLLVDGVESIVSYFADELIEFPLVGNERAEMFQGCISRPGYDDILLLEHAKVLSNKEIAEVTRGHSKLYQVSTDGRESKKAQAARRTYITFTIDDTFAIGIEEVREILEFPESLLKPPGLPHHFKGVFNLRGQLVTIVDARAMYSKEPSRVDGRGKVLIFKTPEAHFGLVVDTVEAIVSFSENERIKLPELLYSGHSGPLVADILEAVEIRTKESKKSMLILNPKSIASRIGRPIAA